MLWHNVAQIPCESASSSSSSSSSPSTSSEELCVC
jgi:hypothetical protein